MESEPCLDGAMSSDNESRIRWEEASLACRLDLGPGFSRARRISQRYVGQIGTENPVPEPVVDTLSHSSMESTKCATRTVAEQFRVTRVDTERNRSRRRFPTRGFWSWAVRHASFFCGRLARRASGQRALQTACGDI